MEAAEEDSRRRLEAYRRFQKILVQGSYGSTKAQPYVLWAGEYREGATAMHIDSRVVSKNSRRMCKMPVDM